MPKEDPTHPPPLRRGDACLYCRKRRIRCSADKPTCQHCAKTGRECTYDSGKPVSRVKQLEEKVAQLESLLKIDSTEQAEAEGDDDGQQRDGIAESAASHSNPLPAPPLVHHSSSESSSGYAGAGAGAGARPGPSSSSYQNQSSFADHQQSSTMYSSNDNSVSNGDGNATNVPAGETFDFNMLEFLVPQQNGYQQAANSFASFGGAFFSGQADANASAHVNPNTIGSGLGNISTTVEDIFDFNMLDPGYMSLINTFQATMAGPDPAEVEPASQSQYSATLSSGVRSSISSQFPNPVQTPIVASSQDSSSVERPPYLNSSSEPVNPRSTFTRGDSGSLSKSHGPHYPPSLLNPGPHSTEDLWRKNPTLHEAVTGDASIPLTPEQKRLIALLHATNPQPPADATPPSFPPTPAGSGISAQPWRSKSLTNGLLSNDSSPGMGAAGTSSTQPSIDIDNNMEIGEDFTLVGGWFNADDLPKVAREHLLDIFFSGMRLFGQEFHVPRFMASLTLPPAKRPHPCLLYSMYTLASRISNSPSIRSLEPHFYSIASRQLEESIGHADRLLDATRASTLLAIYKYSKAKYHEGWMMTGQAARLAISCGLHQIKSSVWKPSSTVFDSSDLVGMIRHRVYVIPAAKDAVEHAERIWTFWSIYVTDRCGSIANQWPPAISDDTVTTPFPRPIFEYELGLVNENDDQSIASIYRQPVCHRPLPHYTESTLISVRLRAMSILERASKLMYEPPEEGWDHGLPRTSPTASSSESDFGIDEYLMRQMTVAADMAPVDGNLHGRSYSQSQSQSSYYNPRASNGGSSKEGWTRTAKIRTPRAYEEVKSALLRIESDLPPEWRTNWFIWDGKVQDWHFSKPRKDLITLHFVLGCAWMFLFDVFAFNAENKDAVNVAKRLTATVRFVAAEVMLSDLDVFIAMTWSFVSKILIREMKRLQSVGDNAGKSAIESDIEVLITALRQFGQRYTMATAQAQRAERYKKSTAEETAFMSKLDDDVDLDSDEVIKVLVDNVSYR